MLVYSATVFYFIVMLYIVLGILNEVRPLWYYVLAAVLFILSQLDYFLLNKVICDVRCGSKRSLVRRHTDVVWGLLGNYAT